MALKDQAFITTKTGGETLQKIADSYGILVSTIQRVNPAVAQTPPTDPLAAGLRLVILIGALTEIATAQFTAVYPAIKDDLAALPSLAPGAANPVALKAVKAFAALVQQVHDGWKACYAPQATASRTRSRRWSSTTRR